MNESKASVLLVDDDQDLLWELGKFLTRTGFLVTACLDGREAIEILEKRGFDAIVTDIALPGASGLVLADWVRKNRSQVPVVIITALGSPAMRELSLLKGAVRYLEKPVDPGLLVDIISIAAKGDGFKGVMDDMDLIDYLQIVLLSGKRVLLEVVSNGGPSGLVFIDSGTVAHATFGDIEGEEAFYRCVSSSGGTVSTQPWRDPEAITIGRRGDSMILEAAHRRDEARGDTGEQA